MIDLYSDNVTQPTPEMYQAMAHAHVAGYGDIHDVAVARLEGLAAELMGKQAALLMSTATLANLTAILVQAERAEEVFIGPDSHIHDSEMGGAGAVAGVMIRTWSGPGKPTLDAIQEAIGRQSSFRFDAAPKPALLCLENTHTASGGAVLSAKEIGDLCELARTRCRRIHLDGARIFNAAAALGVRATDLTAPFDTVTFSLDKCLSAPYGALLAGPAETISEARVWRRRLGGHVRKIAIMAAAGLVALEQMIERVADDNARAASLGRRLSEIKSLVMDPFPVPSNLVTFRLNGLGVSAAEFAGRLLKDHGIRGHLFPDEYIRLAVHRHIGVAEEDAVVAGINDLVRELRAA